MTFERMAAGVMCPRCGTVNPGDARVCTSCAASLQATDNRTSLRKSVASTPAARSRASIAAARRKPDDDAAATDQGDDPAKTAAEDPGKTSAEEPPPAARPKPVRPSLANVASVSEQGRRSNPGIRALPSPPASPPLTSSPGRDQLIGQKLQEYVIQERIGVGGMGVVYRATHELIQKEVAIKVLRGDVVTEPRDVDRMLDEARIINSIKHRGIINVFGAGTLEDGRHYLIMELLEGESLEQLMQRVGTVNAGDAVLILEETLSALGAAHAAGVVHRDLKPANVFLVKEGNKVYVKLLDFGLARKQQQNVTRIAGTPDYISPEHARGRPAGPPADLYAFGVMCFHMLTGKLPFTGNTPMEVMEKHVHHEPPVPHEVNPAIPKALSELILKLLGKEPGERPDATQVKADLRAATKQLRNAATMMSLASIEAVVGGPVAKGDKREEGRARELAVKAQVQDVKRQVKKRWPLVLGGVLGVWLLGVLVYVLWPRPDPSAPRKLLPPKTPLTAVEPPRPASTTTTTTTTTTNPAVKPGDPTAPSTPVEAAVVAADADAGADPGPEVLAEDAPDAGPTGVMAEDLNTVLSDFAVGDFRRQQREGQSIDAMLERMSVEIQTDKSKQEYFGLALKRISALCDEAHTKKELIDCDDELRKLHERFYSLK